MHVDWRDKTEQLQACGCGTWHFSYPLGSFGPISLQYAYKPSYITTIPACHLRFGDCPCESLPFPFDLVSSWQSAAVVAALSFVQHLFARYPLITLWKQGPANRCAWLRGCTWKELCLFWQNTSRAWQRTADGNSCFSYEILTPFVLRRA